MWDIKASTRMRGSNIHRLHRRSKMTSAVAHCASRLGTTSLRFARASRAWIAAKKALPAHCAARSASIAVEID